MKKKVSTALAAALLVVLVASWVSASAESYPDRPITWVVPFGPGGASDRFARVLTESAKQVEPGVTFVVINVPGAQTLSGYAYAMGQPADGYTIYGATTDIVLNIANGRAQYSLDDFVPVVRAQQDVDMLFIRSGDSRFSDFDELIEHAKSDPDRRLKVATTGIDGADAFAVRAVEDAHGVEFINVPYDEPGERYASLMGGIVDILYEQPGDLKAFLETGEYKPILVMAEQRLSSFEDVPTSLEVGVQVVAGYWRGVVAKTGVPNQVIEFLADLFARAMQTDRYREYEHNSYLDLREGYLDPSEFGDFLQKEYEYYEQSCDR